MRLALRVLTTLLLALAFSIGHPSGLLAADDEPQFDIFQTEPREDLGPSTTANSPTSSESAGEGKNSESAGSATLIRSRPQARPYEHPNDAGARREGATPDSAAPSDEPGEPEDDSLRTEGVPRLDDPVLRWLPEIMSASGLTGVPPEIIAAMIRVESTGNPNVISPAGARGLMQVMSYEFASQGIGEYAWHDPATNILAGATEIAKRTVTYGNYPDAIAAYFGFGCDVFGTCTDVYVSVVLGWSAYYAAIIANPYGSGIPLLGPDWLPPAIAPYVVEAPEPPPEPPVPAEPESLSEPPAAPVESVPPAVGGQSAPTQVPAEPTPPLVEPTPPAEPTPIPTEIPTAEPTPVPEVVVDGSAASPEAEG